MRVETLPVGMFMSNCFVAVCEKTQQAIIVDAGDEGERILAYVRDEKLEVRMIVCTHAHIDHVSGLAEVSRELRVPVVMHKEDLVIYRNVPQQAALFGLDVPEIVEIDRFVGEGDNIEFGEIKGEVIHTPGHSPGGISVLFTGDQPPIMFAGDVLFRGSIGRTDLAGSNAQQMIETLRRLTRLDDATVVYSGHGPETTIGHEKRTNPFLLHLNQGPL